MVTSTDPRPDEDVVHSEDHEHWGGTSRHVLPVIVKVLFLGTALALAISITPTLVQAKSWLFLLAVWAIAGILFITYATRRFLPFKYLVPGLLMLVLFVVYPIILTFQTSLTNYGDGTRSTKEETVAQIIGSSVVQTPDAPRYNLSVATEGSKTTGPFTFFLVSQADGTLYKGTEDGLEELSADEVTVENDKITAADGYTFLTAKEVNAAGDAIKDFTVPTDNGAIRALGITTAFEGTTTLEYDADADTITDVTTGTVYTVQHARRPRVLRRRRRQPGVRPVLEGQRRSGELQEAPHQPRDPQRLRQHLHLDVPLRDAVGGLDVHPRAAAGDHVERPQDARPEDLPGDPDHALRHSGLHLAAGVVQLLQPRLRPHQHLHRVGHQLAGQRPSTPGSPC